MPDIYSKQPREGTTDRAGKQGFKGFRATLSGSAASLGVLE